MANLCLKKTTSLFTTDIKLQLIIFFVPISQVLKGMNVVKQHNNCEICLVPFIQGESELWDQTTTVL